MGQVEGTSAELFAAVLDADAHRAARRARLLRLVPFILALHLLAALLLETGRPEAIHLPIHEENEQAPVLTLLAGRPVVPSTVAPAAPPAPAASRRVAARQVPARLKPPPPPTRPPELKDVPPPPEDLPEVGEVPSFPEGTLDDAGGTVAAGIAMNSGAGAAMSEVVGGLIRGVVDGVPAPPPFLTPEEREEWLERYMEELIRSRFMHVRYPHQAAAAGISGQVMLRMVISPKGRLLKLEVVGRCPHPVLCDAAQEAARNAEPYPPPPRELGNPLLLDLPFRYHLH